MIYFHNRGLIVLEAITTLGVSVKKGDNPIGIFGTGIKYAIAILLRTGHTVELERGDEVVKFTSRPHDIRGESFNIVYMNEERLGFTTDLGQNWEVWMAYRELASNAMDEGGGVNDTYVEDDTVWTITAPTAEIYQQPLTEEMVTLNRSELDIEAAYRDHDKIFLSGVPTCSTDNIEIFNESTHCIYYRKVRVHQSPTQFLLKYNLISKQRLTEDRTLDSGHNMMRSIMEGLITLTDEGMLKKVLINNRMNDAIEDKLDYASTFSWHYDNISPEWLKFVGENAHRTEMNKEAVRLWEKVTKKEIEYEPLELTPYFIEMVERAMVKVNVVLPQATMSELTFVKSLGDIGLGMYDPEHDKIYITEAIFNQGLDNLTSCLVEEFVHKTHKVNDFSRPMQNKLFAMITSLANQLLHERKSHVTVDKHPNV